jgi:tetratricopeptide (TPR) repeat protein
VRAAVFYEAGRLEEALAELEAARSDAWYGQTMASPLFARIAERFLRAEILFQLGRYDEAEAWYGSIGEISPPELPYRTVAHLRLSEIATRRGDQEMAERQRDRFEELWADADPEMLAQVAE